MEAESAPLQQLLLEEISARADLIRSRAEEEALLRELPARLKRSGSMSKSWQLLALPARVLPEAVLPAFLKPADADADEVEETPPSALDALIEDSIPTPTPLLPQRVVTDDVTDGSNRACTCGRLNHAQLPRALPQHTCACSAVAGQAGGLQGADAAPAPEERRPDQGAAEAP